MIRSTTRALHLFMLLGLPFFLGGACQAQVEEPAPVELRLPSEIRSEQVQAHYYLTGRFGGYGGSLKAEAERNSYLIKASVNHQPAETLKVILYAPGCQIVTLEFRPLSNSDKTADVPCEDLPPMTFNGRVELPEALRRRSYEVEITYMAYWAHGYFGVADGPVTTFALARVTPDEGGAFHVALPNFTKDAATESYHRDAGLRFIAREPDTNNIVSLLAPANVQGKDPQDLPIKPKYPNEVIFRPAIESPQNQTAGPTQKEGQ